MLITEYTTFEEVRAALGVSDDELEDDQINLPMYGDMLQIDLEDVHVNVPSVYVAAKQAVEAGSASDDQRRFAQAAHLFATYAIARQLAGTLPLFSPEQITDGKAMIRRSQSDSPYKMAVDTVNREFARFRGRLDQMFAVVNSSSGTTTAAKSFLSVVSPGADPVTGV